MKAALVCLMATCVWIGTPAAAHGEDYVVDGPAGCLALGGQWDSTTCVVHRLVLGSDDTLVAAHGVNLMIDGTSYNYGRMQTLGYFQPNALFYNRGTLVTEGTTVPGYIINNTGTFVNRGLLHTHGQIDNYGVFENEARAIFETCSGPLVNYAYTHNAGYLDNWGALIINRGILVNDGSTYNPDADFYRFENAGAFENRGSVYNGGTFLVYCEGAFYGGGSLSGVPLEYEDCGAASQAQMLMSRVFELGRPGSGVLAKKDVIALAAHLAPAAKGSEQLTAAARIELQAFIDDVNALLASGKLPRHLAAALVGWAERILALP